MRAGALCLAIAGLLSLAGCAKKTAPIDTKASEDAVKAADLEWSKAAAAHDLNGVFSFYASDAVVLPSNKEMLTNKSAVQKSWMDMLTPNVDLSWTPMWVEAAKSGEMVYVVGSYTMTSKAGKGKTVTDHGKYMEVWKKQPNGSWKAIADTWNSDLATGSPILTKKVRG